MKGLTRIEWILGILLVVLLGVVVLLAVLLWIQPSAPETAASFNSATFVAQRADDIAPTPDTPGQTARIAYAAAVNTAVAWQPDAVLLNATGTWPQGSSELLIRNGQTTWGFTFYSPSRQEAATISVIDGEATLVTTAPFALAQTPVAATSWQLDSVDALDIYLQNGGSQFLQQEQITILTMYLNADNANRNGRIEWLISLLAPQTGHSLDMIIDANTGDIVTN
ncbi:MAG: hypothetical protein D6835_05400 [Candidatus Thermofonsia bacterium]|nr:MAG: hypothetical protein D6835_05400 [Candidatus Thermofonsia bacterium]